MDKSQQKIISVLVWVLISGVILLIANDIFGWVSIGPSSTIVAGLGAIGPLLLAWSTIRTLSQNEELIKQELAQLTPIIRRLGDYSINPEDKDHIQITLQNVGDGKAIRLGLIPQLYVSTESNSWLKIEDFAKKSNGVNNIPQLTAHSFPIIKSDQTDILSAGKGGVLDPGETAKFSGRISFENEDVDAPVTELEDGELPSTVVFNKLLPELKQTDIERLGLRIKITYTDIRGNKATELFTGPACFIDEIESLSDMLEIRSDIFTHIPNMK
ncbi:hypothetical protein [Haloferax sp. DFSO60]|uniref:hypothetical protein n=1 Tax=Haloferax sp. DFSO60 TaxID=3388652 RepID=UPI00397B4F21